jgi:hypothetical protein
MDKIKLSQGKHVLVDKEDFDWLNKYNWYLINGYAGTQINKKKVYMHSLLNKTNGKLQTDHINQNKLDNRRKNLRSVTLLQNSRNRDKNKNNTSGYKGVTWVKGRNRWLAHIKVNFKLVNLGRFININDAIKARKEAERTLWI